VTSSEDESNGDNVAEEGEAEPEPDQEDLQKENQSNENGLFLLKDNFLSRVTRILNQLCCFGQTGNPY
jgi:hypothetical protein